MNAASVESDLGFGVWSLEPEVLDPQLFGQKCIQFPEARQLDSKASRHNSQADPVSCRMHTYRFADRKKRLRAWPDFSRSLSQRPNAKSNLTSNPNA